uniref:Uncharacterized protein n=1 Tax=Lepeophtheirus salmonis TaxID=72036 RepID=A0A0K2T7U7_LEPSM
MIVSPIKRSSYWLYSSPLLPPVGGIRRTLQKSCSSCPPSHNKHRILWGSRQVRTKARRQLCSPYRNDAPF